MKKKKDISCSSPYFIKDIILIIILPINIKVTNLLYKLRQFRHGPNVSQTVEIKIVYINILNFVNILGLVEI